MVGSGCAGRPAITPPWQSFPGAAAGGVIRVAIGHVQHDLWLMNHVPRQLGGVYGVHIKWHTRGGRLVVKRSACCERNNQRREKYDKFTIH